MTELMSRPRHRPAPCEVPIDAQLFDASGFDNSPVPGVVLVLARFELPFGYCGVLESFWQFSAPHAVDNSKVETKEIEWLVLVNRQPVAPYLNLRHILNPWGWPSPPLAIRLPVASVVEFAVKGRELPSIRVGGRIFGRFWFSES